MNPKNRKGIVTSVVAAVLMASMFVATGAYSTAISHPSTPSPNLDVTVTRCNSATTTTTADVASPSEHTVTVEIGNCTPSTTTTTSVSITTVTSIETQTVTNTTTVTQTTTTQVPVSNNGDFYNMTWTNASGQSFPVITALHPLGACYTPQEMAAISSTTIRDPLTGQQVSKYQDTSGTEDLPGFCTGVITSTIGK